MMAWFRNEGIDQRLLDRLVDGELSDEQERALIAQLEDTPDGWRRCALAFLESRCWQRAAQAVTQPCDDPASPSVAQRTLRAWQAQPWTWALALTAVFALAFGVGTWLPRGGGRVPIVELTSPAGSALQPSPTLAQRQTPASPSMAEPVNPVGDLYLGNLKLVNDSGREIDVPVYDWNRQVAEELMYRSQPLSPELVRQLKRHQVRSSRSNVLVELQDGRQVVLPVQEVDITPVGGTAY